MRENDCRDFSRQIKEVTPCLKRVAVPTKSMVNGSRDFSKRSLDVPKMLSLSFSSTVKIQFMNYIISELDHLKKNNYSIYVDPKLQTKTIN